jgi:hemoglobin
MLDEFPCSEGEIAELVGAFYDAVRDDPALGPIFARHVSDWAAHLGRMTDFWSSVLRGTARYRGTPMVAHGALPGLDGTLFRRWLDLFHATTARQPNAALRERADELARRIARSLWYGYQFQHDARRDPDEIPATASR